MNPYACATCKRPVSFNGGLPALYPFCSERCRMADLGMWLREQYYVDRDLSPEEIADSAGPAAQASANDFDNVPRGR